MISNACWKSSEHIATHTYILVQEKCLSELNSVDLHLSIIFFFINKFINNNENLFFIVIFYYHCNHCCCVVIVSCCTVPVSRCTKHNHEKLSLLMIRIRKTNVLNLFLIQKTGKNVYS